MAEKKFLVDLNLSGNLLNNARIMNGTSFPTPLPAQATGYMFFKSDENKLYVYDGTNWVTSAVADTDLDNTPSADDVLVTSSTGTDTTIAGATILAAGVMSKDDKIKLNALDENAQATTDLLISNNQAAGAGGDGDTPTTVSLTDGGTLNQVHIIDIAANNMAGLFTGKEKLKLNGIADGANYIDPLTLVYDTLALNGGALVANIDWIKDDTQLAGDSDLEVSTTKAVKAYVDASIAGNSAYQGSYDAAANSPDLDTTLPVAGLVKGNYYVVTVAGTFFTTDVVIGDTLIVGNDNAGTGPNVEADWDIVQRVADDATITKRGVVYLSNEANTINGVDAHNNSVVIPSRLKATLEAEFMGGVASTIGNARRVSFPLAIGDSWTVAHGLGHTAYQVQIFEDSTGDEVICGIKKASNGTDVQIDTNQTTAGTMTCVVIG